MSAHPMLLAHITPLLEPLLYAPAFIAVGWALLKARSDISSHKKEHL